MKDEDIGNLLRKVPKQKASSSFTSRLMEKLPEKLPEKPPSVPYWRRPAFAAAAAAVLIVAASSAWDYWREAQERAEAAQRVEALRNEYESLQKELEELKVLAAESQPVLSLGGTQEVDFLMDLRALSREAEESRARPVNYRR
ncbi:MAG: hypothetical protein V3U22_00870 [Vicinamibacteria bacterium]